MPIKTIVMPIDFSPSSENALRFACEMATKQEASIHLVYVVPSMNLLVAASASGLERPVDSGEVEERLIAESKVDMQKKCDALRAEGHDVSHSVMIGDALSAVVETCKSHNADLLVLGVHAHEKARHWIFGSLAESIARHPPCPVLLVPDPE